MSFRYPNAVTGKWVRARNVATREEIANANAEWEIIGPPEIRDVDPPARYFTPFRVPPYSEAMRIFKQPPQIRAKDSAPPLRHSVRWRTDSG